MYRTEEFKNKVAMKDYLKDYLRGEGFLEYCEKNTGCGPIWSCPLYDFNPAGYGKKYKYFYIIGKRVIFDQVAEARARKKEMRWAKARAKRRLREREREEKKAMEQYISQVCQKEKDLLSERIQALEEKYPGSIALSAGSCSVCSQCKRSESGGCRYSEDIRYFIEAMGGSVGETAGDLLGIELQWMRESLPESVTLINGLLTDDPRVEL